MWFKPICCSAIDDLDGIEPSFCTGVAQNGDRCSFILKICSPASKTH
jgi:hypothetical protein